MDPCRAWMGDAPGGGADGLVATADVGYPSAGDAPQASDAHPAGAHAVV